MNDGPIGAVELVRADAVPDDARQDVPGRDQVLIGLCGAGMLVLASVIAWWRRRRRDPLQTAWRSLARRLKLSAQDQERIRTLARVVGESTAHVFPIALLLSQETFLRAASAIRREDHPWATTETLTALQRRVFG